MKHSPILKEGFPYIIILISLGICFYFISIYLSIIFISLGLFIIFFFRNPKRNIIKDINKITSPADGVVLDIKTISEDEYFKEEVVKISIFLSLFNVHANKSPIDGIVDYVHYRPGKYLPAFKSHASDINEKNTIGIKNEKIKILVSQITGFVARRIVCWVKEGDDVFQGENYGLIRFGSCTEIIMPKTVELLVNKGDKVKGGITIIGVIKDEN